MEKFTKALMILTMFLAALLQMIGGGRDMRTNNGKVYNPQRFWGIGGLGLGLNLDLLRTMFGLPAGGLGFPWIGGQTL